MKLDILQCDSGSDRVLTSDKARTIPLLSENQHAALFLDGHELQLLWHEIGGKDFTIGFSRRHPSLFGTPRFSAPLTTPLTTASCVSQRGLCHTSATKQSTKSSYPLPRRILENHQLYYHSCRSGAMVDASSVLGAIGFASNCINILLTTISKADERTDEFRKCRKLFKAHVRKLACVQRRLSGWRVQWSYFSLEDYKAFWGDENVSEVQSRLEDIQTTANGILNDAQRGDRSEEW